ncbi:MAG: tetratricopeptide repeat protein [Bryobacterales bacterium]|nr:tetratricopeptide repeat protein [Bryobacterales bacterium]
MQHTVHLDGDGLPEDKSEAARLFWLAADQGYAGGQSWLGDVYEVGKGVLRNPGRAVDWYRLAAAQDDVFSRWRLGVANATGVGVERNRVAAHVWLSLALASGVLRTAKDLEVLVPKKCRNQSTSETDAWRLILRNAYDDNQVALVAPGSLWSLLRGVHREDPIREVFTPGKPQ